VKAVTATAAALQNAGGEIQLKLRHTAATKSRSASLRPLLQFVSYRSSASHRTSRDIFGSCSNAFNDLFYASKGVCGAPRNNVEKKVHGVMERGRLSSSKKLCSTASIYRLHFNTGSFSVMNPAATQRPSGRTDAPDHGHRYKTRAHKGK